MMFTYPLKQGKDLLPKLLNFSFWPQHSIWEPLLLLNMKLLNIIGKHCGIENTSHLQEETELTWNSIVPLTILKRKKMSLAFSRQMCSYHFPSYWSKLHSRGNGYLKSKLCAYALFCLFLFAGAIGTYVTIYSILLPLQERCGCAVVLMTRRVGSMDRRLNVTWNLWLEEYNPLLPLLIGTQNYTGKATEGSWSCS